MINTATASADSHPTDSERAAEHNVTAASAAPIALKVLSAWSARLRSRPAVRRFAIASGVSTATAAAAITIAATESSACVPVARSRIASSAR
jgi:hypothetical protein